MDHEGSFFHYGQPEKSSSSSNPLEEGKSYANRQLQPGGVREENHSLPISSVIRLMRQVLPPNAKITDEAKVTLGACVVEFISFVTGEANDRCQNEQRKTVTSEDLLWALRKMGFDNYVHPLAIYLRRYRQIVAAERRGGHLPPPPPSPPSHAPGFPVPPNPYPYPYPYPGVFDPMQMGGLYGDGSSGGGDGSSSGHGTVITNKFDPLAYLNRDNFLDG